MQLEKTLPQSAYISPDAFEAERARIFHRDFFAVCRAEDVAAPGDYVVCDVAGESIIVVRTSHGAVAAHYNLCRHRGSQLLSPDSPSGNVRGVFRCPYHSWTYELDGRLRKAPFLDLEPRDRVAFDLI